MKKTICDVCGQDEGEFLSIEVLDGEHPHCGSTMRKNIDVCIYCLQTLKMDLRCNMEFDELRARAKNRG